jgi:hypothetical protein
MYTLSDILDIVNSNLNLERQRREVETKGHFSHSAYSFINEDGDAIWEVFVHFFVDEGHDYPVLRVHHKVTKDLFLKREEEAHKFDMNVLKYLFELLRFGKGDFVYEKFVDGTFNHIITL